MLIENCKSHTCVARVENDELIEYRIESDQSDKIVGNIYKGKVVNVVSGMNAAFVDIGISKNGFLARVDTLVDETLVNPKNKNSADKKDCEALKHNRLRAGDDVLCQVIKEEFAPKGARLSMNISLPGRVLVLMPFCNYIGISKKIENEKTKEKLLNLIEKNKYSDFGYIVRTEAENVSEKEILNEMKRLEDMFLSIQKEYIKSPSKTLIHQEDNLISRTMRDADFSELDEIVINSERMYQQLLDCIYVPDKMKRLFKVVKNEEPMSVVYGYKEQVENMLKKKVELKNGAHIVIDVTEALTVIDVNTSKYVGGRNLEETVFVTNKIAAVEIAKQLRLRNISGIIIVDFIDMNLQEHRQEVLNILEEELKKEKIKSYVVGMTELGLVQITRKKTRNMSEKLLVQECPYCQGNSYIYSNEFLTMQIKHALIHEFKYFKSNVIKLYLNTQVQNHIFSTRAFKEECDTIWRDKIIYLIADPNMHIEKFRIESVNETVIDLPDNARLLY